MSTQYVYWIHTTDMSDSLTQGYVGVSNNTKRRLTNHFSKLRHSRHENQHFQRAFNIDNDLVVDIIFEGPEAECYLKEQELRPARNVGWNINIGGAKPPTQVGNQHARGNKSAIKQVVSPDGLIFESRKAAALYYSVDVTTIHNWLKDPTKPWVKRGSIKQDQKYNISQHAESMKRPIMTPIGEFESVRAASVAYSVVHGTINYWLKTKPTEFYYLMRLEVSA